jgi:hypothetical protein
MDAWLNQMHTQQQQEIIPPKISARDDLGGIYELREKIDVLTVENRSLKEQANVIQKKDDLLAAHNLRLERELAKVTRHVSKLLETKDDNNKRAVDEIRRENEKMLVVSRLREQVKQLEAENKSKGDLITSLQRSQTGTAVLELAVSRDEVWAECTRLKSLISEMEAFHEVCAS